MFKNYEKSFEYTGKNVEGELLSTIEENEYVDSALVKDEKDKIIEEEFGYYNEAERGMNKNEINRVVYKQLLERQRLRFRDAVNIVKESQPDSLPFFAKNLEEKLKRNMELVLDSEDTELKFFTAIDSHLDRYYGVDGFFTIKTDQGEILLTIDLTSNVNKKNYKADYILTVPDGGFDEVEEKKEIIDFNENEAKNLTEILESKINTRKEKKDETKTRFRPRRKRIITRKN